MNKEPQQTARVLNLLRKVDMERASLKKWAVVKLLTWQPLARGIRFTQCDIRRCRSDLMMSYRLPGITDRVADRERGRQSCGYFCPSCGFSNAGTRPVERE